MQKVDLNQVLDLLISEDKEEASKLLHEWFVGKSKAILEEIMQEDDAALEDIEDAKAEIESEEFYADVDLDEADDEVEVEVEDEVDVDVDGDGDADLELATADAVDDLEGELDHHEHEDAEMHDKVEDLEAQLAELKAEFDKLMGLEDADVDVSIDVDGDGDADLEIDDIGVEVEDEFVDEFHESKDEDEEDKLEESDEDFQSLEESYELESVPAEDMHGDELVGDGEKIHIETHSPLPNKKPADRVGGKAVEIKGPTHKGYARQTPPAYEKAPLLRNQVKNAKEDLKDVPKDGDKSALLNKGPKEDKGKSPIGGGAVDLRGSDFKRK